MDRTALQTEIGLRQKDIVATAEAASFNGVNWLVTRDTGSDVTREDVTNDYSEAAYPVDPPEGQFTRDTQITETKTTTQTLGSTSSGISAHTVVNTWTPDPTQTKEVFGASDSDSTSGNPLGYRDVGILFSPDDTTQVDLHPIELFKSFVGTSQSTAYASFADVPSFQYASDPSTHSVMADLYLTEDMDDDLDTPIDLPGQADGLSTVLNLNVATAQPSDLGFLFSGVDRALSALVKGQSVLGSFATSVTSQQAFNSSMVDALESGVGSFVDAEMDRVSTRLAALQTQDQLGTQSLSVANANAGLILKLFEG